MKEYLASSGYVNLTREIKVFAQKLTAESSSPIEAAVTVFYFIRDLKWGASPIYKASEALRKRNKPLICVSKAVLQVALCRALGIPSRLHYWLIKPSQRTICKINELLFSQGRMRFREEMPLYHMAAEIFLERWVIADATVDKGLRKVFEINEWDGTRDVYLSGFEYVDDLGSFRDVPQFVVDASRGKLLPLYLRPLAPIVLKIYNRSLNSIFEKSGILIRTTEIRLPHLQGL